MVSVLSPVAEFLRINVPNDIITGIIITREESLILFFIAQFITQRLVISIILYCPSSHRNHSTSSVKAICPMQAIMLVPEEDLRLHYGDIPGCTLRGANGVLWPAYDSRRFLVPRDVSFPLALPQIDANCAITDETHFRFYEERNASLESNTDSNKMLFLLSTERNFYGRRVEGEEEENKVGCDRSITLLRWNDTFPIKQGSM